MTAVTITIASSLLALLAVAVTVGVLDSNSQRDAWRRVATSRRERYLPMAEDYEELDEYWAMVRRPKRSNLLLKLAQIETSASDLLSDRIEQRTWQLFEIRSELRRLEVWTDEDLVKFDQAMNLRNEIVHGSDPLAGTSTPVSNHELDLLLAKVNGHRNNSTIAER